MKIINNKFIVYYMFIFFILISNIYATFIGDHTPPHNVRRCIYCSQATEEFLNTTRNLPSWIIARQHAEDHREGAPGTGSYFLYDQDIENLMVEILVNPSGSKLQGVNGDIRKLSLVKNFNQKIGVFRQLQPRNGLYIEDTNTVWMELEVVNEQINRIITCFPGRNFQ